MSGTSMATPHITGLVSLIKAFQPNATPGEIKSMLQEKSLAVNTTANQAVGRFADGKEIVAGLMGTTPTPALPPREREQEQIAQSVGKDVAIVDRRITHTAWNTSSKVVNTPVVSNQLQVASVMPKKALDASFVPMNVKIGEEYAPVANTSAGVTTASIQGISFTHNSKLTFENGQKYFA